MRDIDSIEWPSWEVKYSDICRKPYAYFSKGEAKIVENNPFSDEAYVKGATETIEDNAYQ